MIKLELGDQIFSWQGSPEILDEEYFKVRNLEKLHVIELRSNTELNGVILIGNISIIVDSVIYTQSHGAIGETTEFQGSSLAILGLKITTLNESLSKVANDSNEGIDIKEEATQLIRKFRSSLTDKHIDFHLEKDIDSDYIIFGKNDLFLLGSANHLILIHKKKISIRKGENSLVQVDPHNGITIANEKECLRIGSYKKGSDLSFLGDLGVNIATKVLDSFIWE